MFHNAVWGYLSRRGQPGAYGRASLYTVYAARVTAVLGVIFALFIMDNGPHLWLAFIFAWAWTGAESLRRQIQAGGAEDHIFGYDFSRGYTSLGEDPPPRPKSARQRWPS